MQKKSLRIDCTCLTSVLYQEVSFTAVCTALVLEGRTRVIRHLDMDFNIDCSNLTVQIW